MVLPTVLVLGVFGGGVAYTANTVGAADRTAPTVVWDKTGGATGKDPAADAMKGRTDTGLARQLLPVPLGYHLGPDSGEFGNDISLTGRQATTLLKAAGEGTSGKLRREIDKRIDKLGIQGVATRTYASNSDKFVVQVSIVRLTNRSAVRSWSRDMTELLSGDRKGPVIEGHKEATCFQGPKGKRVDLVAVACASSDGELSISVDAYGSSAFSMSDFAELMKDQLDYIASPGKAV